MLNLREELAEMTTRQSSVAASKALRVVQKTTKSIGRSLVRFLGEASLYSVRDVGLYLASTNPDSTEEQVAFHPKATGIEDSSLTIGPLLVNITYGS